ncbi:MAG TPA: hypothetical protein VMW86_04660 [Dehalococcoidales bacterium]|nr:hypothetical protein [Dehalococcoidales bacterium]
MVPGQVRVPVPGLVLVPVPGLVRVRVPVLVRVPGLGRVRHKPLVIIKPLLSELG